MLALFVKIVKEENVFVHDAFVEQESRELSVLDCELSDLLSLGSDRHF